MINEILKERNENYGKFCDHSRIAQNLKNEMRSVKGYDDMSSDKKEALEMIQHKIARILNGDPNYIDSWVDICGYAQLVVNDLEKQK
jgi:hypothetical protein